MSNLWKRLHAMNEAELEAYAKLHHVDVAQEFDDLGQAADYVCAQLQIDRPADVTELAGAEIDELVREYMGKHPDCSYEKALGAVRESNPGAADRYAASFEPAKAS